MLTISLTISFFTGLGCLNSKMNFYKLRSEFQIFLLSLNSLNRHYRFHRFEYIKFFDIFSKFSILNLCVVKHILDHKLEQIRGCYLNFDAWVHLINNKKCLLYNLFMRNAFIFENLLQLLLKLLLFDIFCTIWVQRIPHFMRDCGIDNL